MKILLLLSFIYLISYSYSEDSINLIDVPEGEKELENIKRKVFEELTEKKREALLGNLYEIYGAKINAREAKLAKAIAVLQASSSSPSSALNFFYDCYEKVNYTDKGKDRHEFRAWKEKNHQRYNDPIYKKGLQWSMRWLILELRSTGFEKDADTNDFKLEVESFIKSYISNLKSLKGRQHGVTDGTLRNLVWNIYDIRSNKDFNFPKKITNYASWYQIHRIKPAIKEQSLSDLEKYWDEYIAMMKFTIKAEIDAANTKDLRENKLEMFIQEIKPRLLMEKAMNVYEVGYHEKSVRDSFALLQQYPKHPDYEKWLERLLKVLDPKFSVKIKEIAQDTNVKNK